jgi:hypothetical protein
MRAGEIVGGEAARLQQATASASPIASEAVVLEVGASASGQASAGTLTSRWMSASRARVDCSGGRSSR